MQWIVTALAVVIGILSGAGPASAETRVALVIGNSAYVHAPALANPLNDARDMAASLKAAGFDVVSAFDADRRGIDAAVRGFTDKLAQADVALFFYAGHALQVGAQNYLVPVDAKLERERDLEFEAVKLDFVLRQMEIDREGKTSIVILDACRDNPLSRNLARSMGTRSASIGRGLAAAATGLGTFIAYSTQPGNVALDGAGRNSPFTAALVKHMGAGGRNHPATMIEVRKDVVAATDGKQVPWDHSALTGDFYFTPGKLQGAGAAVASAGSAAMAAMQERLRMLEEEAKARGLPGMKGAEPFIVRTRNRLEGTFAVIGAASARLDDCRSQCLEQAACIGFDYGGSPLACRHFSKVDRREGDPNYQSGVRTEWVTRGADAGSRQFRTVTDQNLEGDIIKTSGADSASGCAVVCRNTAGCVAAAFDGTPAAVKLPPHNRCVTFSRFKVSPTPAAGITSLIRTEP